MLAAVILLLLAGMLGAPIRREYAVDDHPCATADCNGQLLTTNAHYGIPFAWLTLGKSVHQPSRQPASSATITNTKNLLLDIAAWIIIAGGLLFLLKAPDVSRFYAYTRH